MQKFATARWLVNGCQSTPAVHIRKGNPSASASQKYAITGLTRAMPTIASPVVLGLFALRFAGQARRAADERAAARNLTAGV